MGRYRCLQCNRLSATILVEVLSSFISFCEEVLERVVSEEEIENIL